MAGKDGRGIRVSISVSEQEGRRREINVRTGTSASAFSYSYHAVQGSAVQCVSLSLFIIFIVVVVIVRLVGRGQERGSQERKVDTVICRQAKAAVAVTRRTENACRMDDTLRSIHYCGERRNCWAAQLLSPPPYHPLFFSFLFFFNSFALVSLFEKKPMNLHIATRFPSAIIQQQLRQSISVPSCRVVSRTQSSRK